MTLLMFSATPKSELGPSQEKTLARPGTVEAAVALAFEPLPLRRRETGFFSALAALIADRVPGVRAVPLNSPITRVETRLTLPIEARILVRAWCRGVADNSSEYLIFLEREGDRGEEGRNRRLNTRSEEDGCPIHRFC